MTQSEAGKSVAAWWLQHRQDGTQPQSYQEIFRNHHLNPVSVVVKFTQSLGSDSSAPSIALYDHMPSDGPGSDKRGNDRPFKDGILVGADFGVTLAPGQKLVVGPTPGHARWFHYKGTADIVVAR